MSKKPIILLDLFSGIGGFAKGIQDAGYTVSKHYYSEINKHAIANYQHNFKNAIYAGSVEAVHTANIERPHIITFGSPCQDFSISGKRAGLKGNRSSLITQAIRLVAQHRPNIFIWENVKGVFSTNRGADFWAVIQAFTQIGGYRLEWQCVNTKWLLPQNRERIYLIGHLDGSSRPSVFPITNHDCLPYQKDAAKKRWQPPKHSSTITTGNLRATDTYVQVPTTAATITAGGNSGGLHSQMNVIKQLNTHKNFGSSVKQNERVHAADGIMATIARTNTKQTISVNNTENLRRLTEIECERLQGYPDDWTKYGNYNGVVKEIAKTNRYKMIGNAVTATMVQLIVSKLKFKI